MVGAVLPVLYMAFCDQGGSSQGGKRGSPLPDKGSHIYGRSCSKDQQLLNTLNFQ